MTTPIPPGYRTVTPHLVVSDPARAIEFYKNAFGAEETARMPGPDGKTIMHAEIRIGDSAVMLGGEWEGVCSGPTSLGGTSVTLHLYVKDADASYKRAVDAGATSLMAPMDAFWGDRYGKVRDPFGHEWSLATHIKDLTPKQMQEGAQAFFASGCGD